MDNGHGLYERTYLRITVDLEDLPDRLPVGKVQERPRRQDPGIIDEHRDAAALRPERKDHSKSEKERGAVQRPFIDFLFPRRFRGLSHLLSIGDIALKRPTRALSTHQGPHLAAQ